MEDRLPITGDDEVGGGEKGGTSMVTELADGKEGPSGEGREKVTGPRGWGKGWDREGSGVRGGHRGAVG
jgi:hypothetical protein